MSKLNKPLAAKKAQQSKLYRQGNFNANGVYQSQWSQGVDAWSNGTPYSMAWHPHKQQGWCKARDRDISFAEQCPSAMSRVERMLGIAEIA